MLEQLGGSDGFGWALLNVLSNNGWSTSVMRAFGCDDVIVELTRPELEISIKRQGKSVAELAPGMFAEATKYHRNIVT